MHIELFRKQYDFELEQRISIASTTNIPIVAITVVASALSAVLLDYQYKYNPQSYAFLVFSFLALVAIIFSVFFLFRSFWNYEYQKLPSAALLKQHYDELHTWHVQNGRIPQEAKEIADADFIEYVNVRLAEAGDWNGQNNIVRGNYLHMATAAVALSVAALIPAGLIYIHNKATSEDNIHQVEIVNPNDYYKPEVHMSNQVTSGNNKPAGSPAAAPATTPTAAPTLAPNPKPAGPPNVVFKGNTELVKPNTSNNFIKK
ncbi:MAG: hypothetical protein Q8K57_09315 [Thiobacillus sp.]|nr:hypothetical protein [Thiobacillus sp.]MDP3124509.1 hypothetical protein [Thiobacillus sp.]